MARYTTVWQNIFLKLYNNEEEHEGWKQFKAENLSKENILESFEDKTFERFNTAKAKLLELSSRASNSTELVAEMKKEPLFEDEIWRKLLFVIRDRESRPLDNNKTVRVMTGGIVRHMTNEDLEEKLMTDMPDLMMSQTCIPEHLVHDQAELLASEGLRQKVKNMYENEVKVTLEEKIRDNPKKKEEQLRKETEKLVLADIKKSSEASTLQKRKADEAEAIVQRAIHRSAKKYGIPLTQFRGINTKKDVAEYLRDFGIHCSNFGKGSGEVEHDVAVVAALPTGLVVTFIQVTFANFWKYDLHIEMFR